MDKNVKESKKENLQYYKDEIRKMVDEINDIWILNQIFRYIKNITKKPD